MAKIYFYFTVALFCCFMGCKDSEKQLEEKAFKMQQFVTDISSYARNINPDFIIIPQNGTELAFHDTDPGRGIYSPYLNAIDGIGVEALFYNGTLIPDHEKLSMLKQIKQSKTILVSDYLSDDQYLEDAIRRSKSESFLPFPRTRDNYDYHQIPTIITDENSNDISKLSETKNYLYLINPESFGSKQSFISAISATNYDLLLIDLFYDGLPFSKEEIDQLKIKANHGKRLVVAYINIGSAEKYRYYWQSHWKLGKPSWLKKNYQGYPDEIWVEFWHTEWQNIIFGNSSSYMAKIISTGFDGAYLDNVEAYYFLTRNR